MRLGRRLHSSTAWVVTLLGIVFGYALLSQSVHSSSAELSLLYQLDTVLSFTNGVHNFSSYLSQKIGFLIGQGSTAHIKCSHKEYDMLDLASWLDSMECND